MTSINWNDLRKSADDAGFSVLAAGEYDAMVESAEAKKSSSGKDMISCRFAVESGPHAGRKVFNQFVISPENANALGFFFRHMAALGLTSDYFEKSPSLETVATDLEGRRCRVTVSIREWNGQERNQVDKILAPSDGQHKTEVPAHPGGLDAFASAGAAPVPNVSVTPPSLPF
jgi:Protein of unknown function (DUF669)